MPQAILASPLSSETLLAIMDSYPDAEKYWLACSGGMDSVVLLHLFSLVKEKVKQTIEVVYVDHGLNEKSHVWGSFCKQLCEDYDFIFSQVEIREACPGNKSTEAWARKRRYELIAERMSGQDILFTAHHQDDQVETFFLQALRGSGPRGLASMSPLKKFMKGFHARPLLQTARSELKCYAKKYELDWCDDDSNADTRYDRNYLRHKVLPEIEVRWPAYRDTITRLISHQQEYKLLLDNLAEEDMESILYGNSRDLKLDAVQALSIERQKNLVVSWLDNLGLKLPGSRHLNNIISELINIETDKAPCVNWDNVEIRRYRNLLYADKALKQHDVNMSCNWLFQDVMNILGETLTAFSTTGKGISKTNTENAEVVVRYRHGGEKICPDSLSHSKTIKQLFQERGVLPWYRNRIPLVYINDELAVIPGFCVDKKFFAKNDEPSWDIYWSGLNKAIQH